MAFKITKDMVRSAAKKTVKGNPVKKTKESLKEDLVPKPRIQTNTKKRLVSEDARPPMFVKEEIVRLIRDAESRSEEIVLSKNEEAENDTKGESGSQTLSAGKKYVSVELNTFGENKETFSESKIEENKEFIVDPVRGRSGRYWSSDRRDGFVFVEEDKSTTKSYKIKSLEAHNDERPSDFGRVKQWSILTANKEQFKDVRGEYNRDLWSSYIRGKTFEGSTAKGDGQKIEFTPTVIENKIFFDHSYEMSVPFNDDEIEELQIPRGSLVLSATNEYNFYIEDYEKTITKNRAVLDNTLPNLYVLMSELKSEKTIPEFKNFITLDNTLATDEQFSNIIGNKKRREKFDFKKHPIGQYFDLYGRQYNKAVEKGSVERLSKKFSNLIVPVEEIEAFSQYEEKSEMFPMLNKLSFGTDRTTSFAQILSDSQMTNDFMARVVNRATSRESSYVDAKVSIETIVQSDKGSAKKRTQRLEDARKRVWDMAALIEDLRQGKEKIDPEKSVFLGDYQNNLRNGSQFDFYKSLMFTIFSGKFQTLIKQKFRSLEELMNGKKAYSETVMYRISKHEFGSDNAPVQNIWLPNTNKIDVLRYVDTQVKYNKRYTYKVWAYQMVIGTKYWYSNLNVEDFAEHATFVTNMEPSIQLIETPFAQVTLRVADKPPVPPDVNIIPYKGVDNRILFHMNGAVGEHEAYSVLLRRDDQKKFNSIRESQKRETDEKLLFGSDDPVSSFEIFRMEKKPRSYSDFANNLISQPSTDFDLKSLQKASSASFVDRVKPNTKYYYIFRAVDVHEQPSNPTEVYEVEIINENGLVFPTIKVVDFEKEKNSSDKPARRFVQVVPTVLQSLINEEGSGYGDSKTAEEIRRKIKLGLAKNSVWDKTFKMVITSKSTGKKMELIFGFEHKDSEKA